MLWDKVLMLICLAWKHLEKMLSVQMEWEFINRFWHFASMYWTVHAFQHGEDKWCFLLESKGFVKQFRVPVTTFILSSNHFLDCSIISSRIYLLLVTIGAWLMADQSKDEDKLCSVYSVEIWPFWEWLFLCVISPAGCNMKYYTLEIKSFQYSAC